MTQNIGRPVRGEKRRATNARRRRQAQRLMYLTVHFRGVLRSVLAFTRPGDRKQHYLPFNKIKNWNHIQQDHERGLLRRDSIVNLECDWQVLLDRNIITDKEIPKRQ